MGRSGSRAGRCEERKMNEVETKMEAAKEGLLTEIAAREVENRETNREKNGTKGQLFITA